MCVSDSPKQRRVVSIVVPCYNEESTLTTCLDRLLQAFEDEADVCPEILIIDDHSTDRSLEIAEAFSQSQFMKVEKVSVKHQDYEILRH